MKPTQYSLTISFCVLMLATFTACSNKEQAAAPEPKSAEQAALEETATPPEPTQLPVRFQNPGYVVSTDDEYSALDQDADQYALKVGANITSTKGPQPLWDIVKRLGNLKGMSVSWASDVDQSLLVDVNIKADDNFFEALDNLLRQVDYYHEVIDNTIIVKYRETRRFSISLPYMKGNYTTTVGGNFLTDRDAATGTEGTVKITSDGNEYDVWQNITDNLDIIVQEWTTSAETTLVTDTEAEAPSGGTEPIAETTSTETTRQRSQSGSYYTLDKSVGIITVTAPRPMLDKVEYYLENLKKELYRQVIIEAKIIEVSLQDNSRIGLDWSAVLKNFSLNGIVEFGTGGALGQVYPAPYADPNNPGELTSAFVSKVSMVAAPFSVMLNALNEQGEAKVLSNPKLTVLNGQPALISVGKDIAYIKTVSRNVEKSSGGDTVTYTAEVDNVVEGVSMGVVASIIDKNSVILHLTPITTDLVDDTIEYRTFGDGLEVGLPVVGVRQMSTMVEVDNGEMLIIGGLIDKIEGKTGDFAPVLGNIPLVKYLFGVEEKRLEKRELVILLTPRVI